MALNDDDITPVPRTLPGAPTKEALPELLPLDTTSAAPSTGGVAPAPASPHDSSSQDLNTLSLDAIGDIPPPPIPPPPAPGRVAGLRGASTFARPGTTGARPFRTPAFGSPDRGPRFGPGVPTVGASPAVAPGGDDGGLGLGADDAAEILRRLAGGV